MTKKQIFWMLLILCILTLLPFLGLYDYNTKGEPRESIVSYSMIDSGNWILPRNNGGEMAYKPPFFHWCVAVTSYIWGTVTEATSRFPSMVALIALVMSTFSFFAKRKDTRTAALTAVICLTCFELHRAGMNCRVDMVLTALTVGAIYMLYRWYEQGMKRVPVIAILLMSLGTLTKGPVGSIIPCLCTGIFLLCKKENFFKAFFKLFGIGCLTLIIPAFWYYAAWQQGGQEFYDLMYEENIGRMTNTMGYDSCVEPWPFNFLTLLYGFAPFTLLLIMALFSLKGVKKNFQFSSFNFQFKDIDLFSLVCALTILIFYCIPQSKRSVYLMPMYPFTAYFVARAMMWLADKGKKVLKVYGWVLCVISVILLLLTVVLKMGLVPDTIFHGRHAEENIIMLHSLEDIHGIMAWTCIAIVLASVIYWVRLSLKHGTLKTSGTLESESRACLTGIIMLVIALNVGLDGAWKPAALNAKSQKPAAVEVDRWCPESKGAVYEYIEAGVMANGDPVHFFELNYYLKHPNRIGNFHKDKPESGYLLILPEDYELRKADFQRQGYKMQVIHQTQHLVNNHHLLIIQFRK